ncbi:agmatinase family protein [Echinicola jeungdonensis]|uniref:Agmatinase family protein n=1 Tax=Echinicola jeungdonensis TaxID=709343 RepID=A0ABV5J0H4_9BACT|nr:agmatinase family protein [Echinicola jeungdonensis]MDN3671075.1 agmatinase family protein [Echinicola jeungdonensis]
MTTKYQLIDKFDPNGVGAEGTLFGLPFDEITADLIVIPVPWEVTVSYAHGTGEGPATVLAASNQVDLYQDDIPEAWKLGIYMLPIPQDIHLSSTNHRILANNYIDWLAMGSEKGDEEQFTAVPGLINKACEKMNNWVYEKAKEYLYQNKMVALIGGDHSTPLGFIRALGDKYSSFGVLQIDAHADLRKSYEDFEYSHASIGFNILKVPEVSHLVQVGVRDYCEDEADYAKENKKVTTFYDRKIKEDAYAGKTWLEQCEEIIDALPREVYVTIDIDGLDPKLCPHTGTPVPGGFEMEQVLFLMKMLVREGKKIIGFDLVEVAPGPNEDEWDGNVGARVFYRMANLFGVSQGKLDLY